MRSIPRPFFLPMESRRCLRRAKEGASIAPKQDQNNQQQNQPVRDNLLPCVQEADGDVKRHPGNGQPTGPVAAAEQEDCGNNPEQVDKCHPDGLEVVGGKRMGIHEVAGQAGSASISEGDTRTTGLQKDRHFWTTYLQRGAIATMAWGCDGSICGRSHCGRERRRYRSADPGWSSRIRYQLPTSCKCRVARSSGTCVERFERIHGGGAR